MSSRDTRSRETEKLLEPNDNVGTKQTEVVTTESKSQEQPSQNENEMSISKNEKTNSTSSSTTNPGKVTTYGNIVQNDTINEAAARILVESTIDQTISNANYGTYKSEFFTWEDISGTMDFDGNERFVNPFSVVKDIPRLFEYKTVVNTSQSITNDLINSTNLLSEQNILTIIDECKQHFNENTMVTRIGLRSKVNGVELGDVNTMEDGVIKMAAYADSKSTYSSLVQIFETKLKMLLRTFIALDNKIYYIPPKIAVVPVAGNAMQKDLSNMTYFVGTYPHFYMTAMYTNIPWLKDELENLYRDAPAFCKESDVREINKRKVTSIVTTFTDQFASVIADMNFNRFVQTQLHPVDYLNRIKANMGSKDMVNFKSGFNSELYTFLYKPEEVEWNLAMIMTLTNEKIKHSMLKMYRTMLPTTSRLQTYPFETVWNGQNKPSDPVSNAMLMNLSRMVAVGDDQTSPYDMLLFETFSSNFEFALVNKNITSDAPVIIDFMCYCLFIKLFPRAAQKMIHLLGARMMIQLKTLLPRIMSSAVKHYGYTVTKEGKNARVNTDNLTAEESRSGLTYMIFSELKVTADSGVPSEFVKTLNALRKNLMPKVKESKIVLSAKKEAGYPYYADNYQTYTSWEHIDPPQDFARPVMSDLTVDVQQIVIQCQKLLTLHTRAETNNPMITKSASAWINMMFGEIMNTSESIGLLFGYTMRQLQVIMMNSFGYVIDMYNPEDFFFVPPKLVVAPYETDISQLGQIIDDVRVMNFDPSIAIKMLLAVEGEFSRNLVVENRYNVNEPAYTQRPARMFMRLDPVRLDNFAMSVVKRSRQFGLCMQLREWLINPDSDNNILRNFSHLLKGVMNFTNWSALMEEIFNMFDLNFRDYYTSSHLGGKYDTRRMTLTIKRSLGRGIAMDETGEFNIFGRKWQYLQSNIVEILKILKPIIMDHSSFLMNSATGLYIGKFLVDELTPYIPDIELNYDHVYTMEAKEKLKLDEKKISTVSFNFISSKGGMTPAMNIKKYIYNEETNSYSPSVKTYYLPRDRNMPNIMIHAYDGPDFNRFYEPIAKAIIDGYFVVKIHKQQFIASIVDRSTRTVDYSTEAPSVQDISGILQTKSKAYIELLYQTTTYATNFVVNQSVIPQYIQWYVSAEPLADDVFCTVLNFGITPSEQTRLPTRMELEYGIMDEDKVNLKCSDGDKKINKNFVNWNNSYHALHEDAWHNIPELVFTQATPMDDTYFE
uniref:Major core protein n=1 Tax=Hubei odonate virus 14 TaxID=1922995 RepID=A0A1L3KP68_9VIRU|nr:Major core protein [Hubei odonate virus 14]